MRRIPAATNSTASSRWPSDRYLLSGRSPPNGSAILLRTNLLSARGARTNQADPVSSNRLLDSALEHFGFEPIPELVALDFEIVAGLEIEPESL